MVAGASVTANEMQTGIRHVQTTDAGGEYGFHDLLPGVYTVEVTANGFANSQTEGVVVNANLVLRSDQQTFTERRGANG